MNRSLLSASNRVDSRRNHTSSQGSTKKAFSTNSTNGEFVRSPLALTHACAFVKKHGQIATLFLFFLVFLLCYFGVCCWLLVVRSFQRQQEQVFCSVWRRSCPQKCCPWDSDPGSICVAVLLSIKSSMSCMTTCKGLLLCSEKGTGLELDRDCVREDRFSPKRRERCGVEEKKAGKIHFF